MFYNGRMGKAKSVSRVRSSLGERRPHLRGQPAVLGVAATHGAGAEKFYIIFINENKKNELGKAQLQFSDLLGPGPLGQVGGEEEEAGQQEEALPFHPAAISQRGFFSRRGLDGGLVVLTEVVAVVTTPPISGQPFIPALPDFPLAPFSRKLPCFFSRRRRCLATSGGWGCSPTGNSESGMSEIKFPLLRNEKKRRKGPSPPSSP